MILGADTGWRIEKQATSQKQDPEAPSHEQNNPNFRHINAHSHIYSLPVGDGHCMLQAIEGTIWLVTLLFVKKKAIQ